MNAFKTPLLESTVLLNEAPKPWVGLAPSGEKLRPREVSEMTGLSKSKLYELISQGKFPPFLKPSNRVALMPQSWLDAYFQHLADEAVRSMSDHA